MNVASLESQRTGLIQTLVLVIMLVMGLILVLSWRSGGYLIPSLALVCLVACWYVIARERQLKRLHYELLEELNKRGVRVRLLGRKLKEEEDRTNGVFQLTRALSRIHSQSSSNRIYSATLEVALDLVGGNCASILLLQGDGRLHFQHAIGLADGVSEMTLAKGKGMAGWVVQHAEPLLLVENRACDERLADPVAMRVEAQMAMAIPIPMDGEVRAVMCLGSSDPETLKQFSEEHLRLAYTLCQYASSAIELAGLKVGGDGATVSMPLVSSQDSRLPESLRKGTRMIREKKSEKAGGHPAAPPSQNVSNEPTEPSAKSDRTVSPGRADELLALHELAEQDDDPKAASERA